MHHKTIAATRYDGGNDGDGAMDEDVNDDCDGAMDNDVRHDRQQCR